MWRDTMRSARLYVFDSRASVFLLVWAFHMAWWTFYLAIAAIAIFTVIEFFGMTIPVALRTARAYAAGPLRPAIPFLRRRRRIDYGGY